MTLTTTDLFCGLGGSSTGAESVAGVRVRMASNHWDLAIETHNRNMPHVDHDVADIAEVDPARYPRTDLLWASPSCTFWSQARGEKRDFAEDPTIPTLFDLSDMDDHDDERQALPDEARERSRALMHDVPRFAEHHRYKAVIVENTLPLLSWWYFPKWIARMRALGYLHKVLTLNSAFAQQLGDPAPQLRDRVYVVFWQDRYPAPDFDRWTRPQAWCPGCEAVVTAMIAPKNPRRPHGAYGAQWVLRCPSSRCRHGVVHPYVLPALAAIDLDVPGTRIGDKPPRARYGGLPLAPKTMARIQAGVRRYAQPAGRETSVAPFVSVLRTHGGNQAVTEPLRTFVAGTTGQALLVPVEGRDGKHASPTVRPHRTQTGRNETALVLPPLLMRNNTPRGNPGQMVTPVTEPARTITATGKQSLIWNPDLLLAYDTGLVRRTRVEPLPTQTTVEGDALLESGVDVMDCLFRMLLPEEIKLGMAFPSGFILLGNKTEQVRLCGNAVTPPIARDLIAAVAEAITGDEVLAA